MSKIRLIKSLDRALGGLLAVLFPPPSGKRPARTARRFLVIRPGGIGDAVLLVPAIQAIKDRFPHAEITVLAERRNASVFSLCPQMDWVLLYDKPAQLLRAISGKYDVVIDTEQWHRLSAVVGRLCRAPVSVGFATNHRKRLFLHQVPYRQDVYEVESFYQLLAPLGITNPKLTYPFLTVPTQAALRAAELLSPLSGADFVVLFPGASIAERRWGAERFQAVAKLLAGEGMRAVVVGGKEDFPQGEVIVQGNGGLNLAGKTTLAETAAVIGRSRLLVSGDSGILHLAVGMKCPTVSLFGPGIAAKWAPRNGNHHVLNRNLPCSPCTLYGTTPPCPIGARCLGEISVEDVWCAVKDMLSKLVSD